MRIGVLGALGLGMLMFTVISLIQKIESALNFTWRLHTTRNMSQRFSNYLSVIMVGPVLVFSAVGISASLKSHAIVAAIEALPYMGDVVQILGALLPYLLIISAFAFVYLLVPNTRVPVKSALYGALVAGIMWRLTGTLFASFAGGSTSYTAIYSGFAILLLFMIWLYLGWLILLIGASIAYYHQHPEQQRWQRENLSMSAVLRENLALQLMLEIGRDHDSGDKESANLVNLAKRMNLPERLARRMLRSLLKSDLIVEVRNDTTYYLPARSIDRILLIDIIRQARLADNDGQLEQMSIEPVIQELQQDMDSRQQQRFGEQTLKDLIEQNTGEITP